MLDFTQCDWIDLTKLTRYHQNLMSFLSENYLNKSGGTMNGQINSCSILPKSPSSYNLGSSTNQWSNIYSNGFVLVDSTGQIRPNSTGTGNIGTSSYYWGNAYINNIYGIAIYQNGNQVWDKSNLQVGGVNLYNKIVSVNSRCEIINNGKAVKILWAQYSQPSNIQDTYFFIRAYKTIANGKQYTISFTCTGLASDNDYCTFAFQNWESYKIRVKNGRCSYTFTSPATFAADTNILIDDHTSPRSLSAMTDFTLTDWQIEEGNVATTYSPAPEDTDALITTAQNKADSAYINNQATQTQLDNLQVGGRNLIIQTGRTFNSATAYNNGFKNLVADPNALGFRPEIKAYVNNSWKALYNPPSGEAAFITGTGHKSLSFKALNNADVNSSILIWFGHLGASKSVTAFYTFPSVSIVANKDYTMSFDIISNDLTVANGLIIDNIKLEEGNRPTTWTPAPEDVDANISTAQSTANTAVTNLNNINLMTTASVDALFNLTSATNALESVQTMDSDDITDILHDR